MYYILSRISPDLYAVFGEKRVVEEFSISELRLLCNFVHIIGCEDVNCPLVSILYHKWGAYSSIAGQFMYQEYNSGLENAKMQGYLIIEDGNVDSFVNLHILMQHGVKAVVTQEGRLLYLDTCDKHFFRLGSICSKLGSECIPCDGRSVVYEFDDRIVSVAPDAFKLSSFPAYVDITDVTNKDTLSDLGRLAKGNIYWRGKKGV